VKHACFKAIYIQMRSFYQDRLGTNVGKTPKQDRFLSGYLGAKAALALPALASLLPPLPTNDDEEDEEEEEEERRPSWVRHNAALAIAKIGGAVSPSELPVRKTASFFECFPMFVPSLSWFIYKWLKNAVFLLAGGYRGGAGGAGGCAAGG
jgi:hypothetical protein